MDSEQKHTVVAAVLFLAFLLVGLPYISKFADPFTSQTAMFRDEEIRVAVYKNRHAIRTAHDISGTEVFEQEDKVMTRLYTMAPRASGVLITTQRASADEGELLRKFFPREERM